MDNFTLSNRKHLPVRSREFIDSMVLEAVKHYIEKETNYISPDGMSFRVAKFEVAFREGLMRRYSIKEE